MVKDLQEWSQKQLAAAEAMNGELTSYMRNINATKRMYDLLSDEQKAEFTASGGIKPWEDAKHTKLENILSIEGGK